MEYCSRPPVFLSFEEAEEEKLCSHCGYMMEIKQISLTEAVRQCFHCSTPFYDLEEDDIQYIHRSYEDIGKAPKDWKKCFTDHEEELEKIQKWFKHQNELLSKYLDSDDEDVENEDNNVGSGRMSEPQKLTTYQPENDPELLHILNSFGPLDTLDSSQNISCNWLDDLDNILHEPNQKLHVNNEQCSTSYKELSFEAGLSTDEQSVFLELCSSLGETLSNKLSTLGTPDFTERLVKGESKEEHLLKNLSTEFQSPKPLADSGNVCEEYRNEPEPTSEVVGTEKPAVHLDSGRAHQEISAEKCLSSEERIPVESVPMMDFSGPLSGHCCPSGNVTLAQCRSEDDSTPVSLPSVSSGTELDMSSLVRLSFAVDFNNDADYGDTIIQNEVSAPQTGHLESFFESSTSEACSSVAYSDKNVVYKELGGAVSALASMKQALSPNTTSNEQPSTVVDLCSSETVSIEGTSSLQPCVSLVTDDFDVSKRSVRGDYLHENTEHIESSHGEEEESSILQFSPEESTPGSNASKPIVHPDMNLTYSEDPCKIPPSFLYNTAVSTSIDPDYVILEIGNKKCSKKQSSVTSKDFSCEVLRTADVRTYHNRHVKLYKSNDRKELSSQIPGIDPCDDYQLDHLIEELISECTMQSPLPKLPSVYSKLIVMPKYIWTDRKITNVKKERNLTPKVGNVRPNTIKEENNVGSCIPITIRFGNFTSTISVPHGSESGPHLLTPNNPSSSKVMKNSSDTTSDNLLATSTMSSEMDAGNMPHGPFAPPQVLTSVPTVPKLKKSYEFAATKLACNRTLSYSIDMVSPTSNTTVYSAKTLDPSGTSCSDDGSGDELKFFTGAKLKLKSVRKHSL